MNFIRTSLLGLLCAVTMSSAWSQWQWVDGSGRKVFSDRPPPVDVPAKDILKRPKGAGVSSAAPVAPQASASAAKGTPTLKLSGKDAELEARRKEAEQAEAAKKKAADDKLAADRAENCQRVKGNLVTLESGQRIRTTTAAGEREVMDDQKRAEEIKRAKEIMARECAPAAPAR